MAVTRVQASYAVIRYIPSILREEFINVGVILVCPEKDYQGVQTLPSFGTEKGKMSVFDDADGRFVRHAITKLTNAAEQRRFDEFVGGEGAPQGLLSTSGLVLLSRTYHNNIRLSEPRTVLTENPGVTLSELYSMFVGFSEEREEDRKVTRGRMRTEVTQAFNRFNLFSRFPNRVRQEVKPLPGSTKVDIVYKNGISHFYQVIPFVDSSRTADAVSKYRMLAIDVRNSEDKPEYENAEFAIFGYYAPVQGQADEIEEIKERVQSDDIKLLDYREDALSVARQISRELDADSGVAIPAD